ncbi:MAG: serine/threonine-protein kinase [Clostridiales bacterium]|nr:serine/threonine-protein kinase [Clostridiales bacterium]
MKYLGHGGNGQVYLATHLSLHSCCAIKRVSKEQDSYSQTVKEARLLRLLNHSGIPHLFDFEEDEQYGYLIEEYIPGDTLKNYCKNNKIELYEITDIMVQICGILSYLHQQKPPVFFLDLKPENVIYKDGKVTLIDFGNAHCQGEEQSVSYGTVGYAAPEQYGLLPVDERSDIYGAGVLLKFLLEEQKKETDRWKKDFLAEEKILLKIADRCMQFHPMKRYRNIKEVENQLCKMMKKGGKRKEQGDTVTAAIALASCNERMGTTHAALWLCAWQNERGTKTYYVDCSQNKHAEKFIASQGCMKSDGSYEYKHVRLLPYYLYGKERRNVSYILDCGCYWNMEEREYEESTVRCLVAGTNPWERENLRRVLRKENAVREMPVILYAFSGEDAVRRAERELGINQGIRIPYCPGIEEICEGGKNENAWMEELLEYVHARDGPVPKYWCGRDRK